MSDYIGRRESSEEKLEAIYEQDRWLLMETCDIHCISELRRKIWTADNIPVSQMKIPEILRSGKYSYSLEREKNKYHSIIIKVEDSLHSHYCWTFSY
ncbi:hypothetical protein [Bacillus sp. 165]|uniref:hypothetical protein n=1 Tax=Bacillus sp. 165 TaxID=1529117 RepID=UPI001ADC3824|nr:hypothetical protein [Bacillus sp. 165]MBO9129384.1 hypothetical protein [Bacillus sp. 165]